MIFCAQKDKRKIAIAKCNCHTTSHNIELEHFEPSEDFIAITFVSHPKPLLVRIKDVFWPNHYFDQETMLDFSTLQTIVKFIKDSKHRYEQSKKSAPSDQS